ncbi:MAG TPA: stage II sporulation protein P [Ruminiclostridium sp.]
MREIARSQRSSIYNTSNIGRSKSNLTKLPIILCAVVGILLGSLAFKVANGRINNAETESLKNDFSQSKPAVEYVNNKQASSSKALELFKDGLFKFFGMDRYNPITIVNANSPYFKIFYENQYLQYSAQIEQQEVAQKAIADEELRKEQIKIQAAEAQKNIDKANSEAAEGILKEVSSSISFESDVDAYEKEKNPVVSNGKINIKNETKYSIDINKLLNEPLKLTANKKGPQILVFHTHTTEAFLKNINELSTNVPSRTSNNKYNVVSVGEALTNNLEKYNIDVLHNTTVHDLDYNSSYAKSLKTLTSYVDKYPSLKMTIDLHRDAVPDQKLRVVKKINGKDVAQIMFVIGTDSKLSNTKWRENLKLAIKVQARLNEICPGITKPIYLSQSRYNQHLTNGSVIIEIGGDGNVIDECLRSTTYLAQAINDVLYKNK